MAGFKVPLSGRFWVPPDSEIYLICPPKPVIPFENYKKDSIKIKKRISDDLIKWCKGHQYITKKILENSLLPDPVKDKGGNIISCPSYWKDN